MHSYSGQQVPNDLTDTVFFSPLQVGGSGQVDGKHSHTGTVQQPRDTVDAISPACRKIIIQINHSLSGVMSFIADDLSTLV